MKSSMQTDEVILDKNKSLIRWNPILAGILVALFLVLLFNLLGTAIGCSLFFPKIELVKPLGIGTLVWIAFTSIVSMYTGGWIAGCFSQVRSTLAATLYGALVSAISALLSFILIVTAVGALFNTSFSLLGNVLSASKSVVTGSASFLDQGLQEISRLSPELGAKVQRALPDLTLIAQEINQNADELISQKKESTNSEVSAEKIKSQIESLIKAYLESDETTIEASRDKLIQQLTEATGKSPEELQQTIEKWHQTYVEAKEKAIEVIQEASQKIAKIISNLALVNFFMLISAMLASVIGAIHGRDCQDHKRTYSNNY